jgi:hypothetical protein
MSKVKIGAKDQPVLAKVQLIRDRVTLMTGNPNFPSPTPSLAQLTATADALQAASLAAQRARQASKLMTSLQDEQTAAADLMLVQLGNYVDTVSGGSSEKILSAGFSVRARNTKLGTLGKTLDLTAVASSSAGTVEVSWKGVRGGVHPI